MMSLFYQLLGVLQISDQSVLHHTQDKREPEACQTVWSTNMDFSDADILAGG